MFRRLFGETPEEQIAYLQKRVIATLAVLVLCGICFLFQVNLTGVLALILLFVWGWGVVKALFGITTIGVIFSGNVVIGVILFLFYVIVAYLAGVICAFVGTGRYFYLLAKRKTNS